jgi:hypothetical protein
MAKLLTHHDPGHIHALVGLLNIIHYIYRIFFLVVDVDNGGFGINLNSDIFCLLLMTLPNVTSFIFTIVRDKKGTDGFTIWSEYRAHAFLFAAKLWLLLCMYVYAKHFVPGGRFQNEIYIRATAEFATMAAAHYITNLYPKQESTIRGMYKDHQLGIFLAGFMQFMGRAAIIYGTPDPRDAIALMVLSMAVLQLNAFNMTLRKKRLIGPKTTQTFYSVMLLLGFYMIALRRFLATPPTGLLDPRLKFLFPAALAYYCRRYASLDRFTSWIVALATLETLNNKFHWWPDRVY